jgi:hypothetical protein
LYVGTFCLLLMFFLDLVSLLEPTATPSPLDSSSLLDLVCSIGRLCSGSNLVLVLYVFSSLLKGVDALYVGLSLATLGRDSLDRLCSVPSASRPVVVSGDHFRVSLVDCGVEFAVS